MLLIGIIITIWFFLSKKIKKSDHLFATWAKSFMVNGLFIIFLWIFIFLTIFFPAYFEIGQVLYFLLLYGVIDYFFSKEPYFTDKKSIFLFSCLCATKFCVVDLYATPTPSMTPTIEVNKSYIFKKYEYGLNIPFMDELLVQWKKPNRQDIIIFHHKYKGYDIPYMKRVIAVEGDTVYYDFSTKRLSVLTAQGEFLRNEYEIIKEEEDKITLKEKNKEGEHLIYVSTIRPERIDDKFIDYYGRKMPQTLEVKVGKDEMFVMGDNRDGSEDSRFFGPVSIKRLIAKH